MARRVRVAIFENDRDMAMLVGVILDEHGFDVAYGPIGVFARTEAAIRAFVARHEPDVIVWDMDFPYLAQCELLARFRADPGLGLIPMVLTATSGPAVRTACGDVISGLAVHTKPYAPTALVHSIETALKQ